MALRELLLRKSHILGLMLLMAGCAGPQVVPLQGWLADKPEWRVAQVNAGSWPLAVVEVHDATTAAEPVLEATDQMDLF